MKKQRPSGICTQLYECRTCGWQTYQPPGATVEHPCPSTKTNKQLKEIKQ